MNWNERPLSVNTLACLYLVVGTVGFVYHFSEFLAFRYDSVEVELTEVLAIVSGAFMLRGRNWARWLALAWIASHVVLSAFHTAREFGLHILLFATIAWILFRPDAAAYFRSFR